MNEGSIDYQEIIHKLLKGEIRVLREIKKVEKKYKEVEEKKNGNNEIRTCGDAGKRK